LNGKLVQFVFFKRYLFFILYISGNPYIFCYIGTVVNYKEKDKMNLSILVWLLACGDKETETAEPVEETDTDTDSEPTTDVTFSLTGSEGMKIGLAHIIFPEEAVDTADQQDEGPEFTGSMVVSSELSTESTFTIGVETPDDSQLFEINSEEEARLGLWAPFLFQDSNGDDAFTEGETITGFSMNWLVYSTLDVPEFNITQGWGAIEMTFTEEPPTSVDLENVPLDANLTVVDSVTIGGSFDTALGDKRIAFVPIEANDASQVVAVVDEVATNPWTVTFSGAPPESHYNDGEDEFQMAMEIPLVYEDVNGNGAFEIEDMMDESSVSTVCYDGMGGMTPQSIVAVYSSPPTDFRAAMYLRMYNLGCGWSIMINTDSDPIFLSSQDHNNMVIDSTCVME
jgi:hypothetical protein